MCAASPARGASDLGDDLVSQLLIAESDGGKLSEDELVATVVLLLNAGHEATVQAISNGVKIMLEQQVDARQAFASESVTQATVEELLRLDPPLHLFARYARKRSSSPACVCARARRSAFCSAPPTAILSASPSQTRSSPARTPNPHVSFGAGIHFCVGAPLARLELAVALPILFGRLPRLAPCRPPRYRNSFHFHGLESLKVEWG